MKSIRLIWGDDTLTADPTPGSSVAASSECMPDEPVVVESEFESEDGDGDGVGSVSRAEAGAGSVSGAGGEGGAATFQKKER
jgi:hypothetical protein